MRDNKCIDNEAKSSEWKQHECNAASVKKEEKGGLVSSLSIHMVVAHLVATCSMFNPAATAVTKGAKPNSSLLRIVGELIDGIAMAWSSLLLCISPMSFHSIALDGREGECPHYAPSQWLPSAAHSE